MNMTYLHKIPAREKICRITVAAYPAMDRLAALTKMVMMIVCFWECKI